MSRTIGLCLLPLALILGGCAEAPAGKDIKGSVTLGGQPLDQGTIEFSPAAGQGTFSGGPITNGEYSIPADRGLEPGLYDVRISSIEGGVPRSDEMPGELKAAPKQRIPPEYNSATTLKADVRSSGENKFDFVIP